MADAKTTDSAWLPYEKLDVYRVALELHSSLLALVPSRGRSALRDQLNRASMSVVLNIAEGAGRPSGAEQRRHFDIAKASATECAAVLDILRMGNACDLARCAEARALLIRTVQMLSKLIARE